MHRQEIDRRQDRRQRMRIAEGNTSVMQAGMDRQEPVQQRDGVTGREERVRSTS